MKENSEGNRFKVGDRVRIARVDDSYKDTPDYKKYVDMIGTDATVIRVRGAHSYVLDLEMHEVWLDSELEPAKESQVLEILRKWQESR